MAELTRYDLINVENRLGEVENIVNTLNNKVDRIAGAVERTNIELKELAQNFQALILEQRRTAALQKATTELIRVRQEIERDFGNYYIARKTMLGILQATDSALVRKTTISRVSEELILSTPRYWLAPCLVALAAWIGNDRALAERAIKEAVKRDEERTALTMALICRRNNRIQTCYEWLSVYFSHQKVANFSEGSFVYIDAYVNGIFGKDEKHICDDYITNWMSELKEGSDLFDEEQEEYWKQYYMKFCNSVRQRYPELSDTVMEFERIDGYASRLFSISQISDNFNEIVNAEVDQEKLKKAVDEQLVALVNRYDADEERLLKEEQYFKAVKKYGGDEDLAKDSIILEERQRKQEALNLVEQMRNVITTSNQAYPSMRKTAVSFMTEYINKGFNNFVAEKRADFPETINMSLDGWRGSTMDGSNLNSLWSSYDSHMSNSYQQESRNIDTEKSKNLMIGGGVVGGLGVISFILNPIIAIILVVISICCFVGSSNAKKEAEEQIKRLNSKYAARNNEGRRIIATCINQWNDIRGLVFNFDNNRISNIV